MELGDFEPANEFEFDLSDVDVAAFESVATEDTSANAATTQATESQDQQLTAAQLQQSPPKQLLPQSPKPPQTQQAAQHHVTQISPASGAQPGKILLVPINSKTGTPGFKHFLQLPAGTSSLALGALTTSGNKKQVIQLTSLTTSALNVSKNNYSFPISASSQALAGSSHGSKPQQVILTTSATNNSPAKNHHSHINFNHVSGKSLNSSQNNITPNLANAHLASTKNVSAHNDSLRASTPTSTIANEVPKRKPCNCTKSQCLKLYCDCFANGEFCSGCNCTNCFNSLENEKERQKAISQCLERNPEAFRPKIGKAVKASLSEETPDSVERRHTKGCNCKRSGCLKNYCECYEAKILCSNLCKCCGCKNYEESFERRSSLMQLSNQASEHARGILKNLLPTNNNSTTVNEFTKCFITDKVIRASLTCLLQSAQQAEIDGVQESDIPNLIQTEMGKCLRMIVDSAIETTTGSKKR